MVVFKVEEAESTKGWNVGNSSLGWEVTSRSRFSSPCAGLQGECHSSLLGDWMQPQ